MVLVVYTSWYAGQVQLYVVVIVTCICGTRCLHECVTIQVPEHIDGTWYLTCTSSQYGYHAFVAQGGNIMWYGIHGVCTASGYLASVAQGVHIMS